MKEGRLFNQRYESSLVDNQAAAALWSHHIPLRLTVSRRRCLFPLRDVETNGPDLITPPLTGAFCGQRIHQIV